MPTSRGRNQVLQASGTTPRREKTKPIRAAEEAIRMSMARVTVAPKPTAGPLMAAMTGFFMSKSRNVTSPPPSRCSPSGSCRPRVAPSKVCAPPDRSAPAQNARPAPVTMTARTASSASAASKAAMSSPIIAEVTALSFSGRQRVTVAMPSAAS